jgi:hypothetical protein
MPNNITNLNRTSGYRFSDLSETSLLYQVRIAINSSNLSSWDICANQCDSARFNYHLLEKNRCQSDERNHQTAATPHGPTHHARSRLPTHLDPDIGT